jgi:hypothetical protein
MRAELGVALLLVASASGCPRASGSASPSGEDEAVDAVDEPAPPDLPLLPTQPANREPGEQLELTIPLLGDDPLALASLRGRPVVLDISSSSEQGWTALHAFEHELVEAHPDVVVIVVSLDADAGALTGMPSNLALAWDPDGALAARLSLAILPTLFVLDRQGRIVALLSGYDEEDTLVVLSQAVDEALASAPTP